MAKTIKQLADELGVSKQRVYRYIKNNCINEAYQENGVMYFDDTAEKAIIKGLSVFDARRDIHHDVHHDTHYETVIDVLKQQLSAKDEQIKALQAQVSQLTAVVENTTAALTAAQALHAADKQLLLDRDSKKTWWRRKEKN